MEIAGKNKTKRERDIWHKLETLIYNKNIAYSLLIVGIILSLLVLPVTQSANLFENADLYKFTLFASGTSPYSILPWQAPYPPLYFMMWLFPYVLITSVTSTTTQTYLGFKLFSLIIVYLTTFVIYKTQRLSGEDRNKTISLSALFLIGSQYSLIVLAGDSIGFLLLALGAFFFIQNRDMLGVFFVLLSILFKIQPILGLLAIFIFIVKYQSSKLINTAAVTAVTTLVLLIIPLLTLFSNSFQNFAAFDYNNLQLYNFNIYSGIADLSSNVFHLNITAVSQFLANAWIVTLLLTIFIFTYVVFKTKLLKKAKLIDVLAIGLLIWIILFKQTLPYYFLWPSVVLLASGRTRSFLLLLSGEVLGSLFFIISYVLLGNAPTNYAIPPPIGVSILFLTGGILFVAFGLFALRELISEIT